MMSNDERRRARALAARRRRRRRRIIIGVVLSVILLAVGIALCLTVFFKISAVEVTGDEVYNADQVVEASGITLGENLFLLPANDIETQIETTLPYVETAEISRSLSGTVTVHITAAKAAAAIDNGDSYTLLSASGKVLEDGVMSVGEDVLLLDTGDVLSCVPGEIIELAAEDAVADMTAALGAFSDASFAGLTRLDVREHTNIKAVYQGRITLELGMASTITDKLDFVMATLSRSDQNNPEFRGTIDFTIENRAYQNAETDIPATQPASQPESATESQTASQAETTTAAAA